MRGVINELNAFEAAVKYKSCAVMCRPITDLVKWLDPSTLYISFHNAVASGARIAQDNKYDRVRGAVDELLFPEYSEKVVFAALSLDQHGDPYYGDFSITIRSDSIASRATVFHENSYRFLESRGIKAVGEVPAGYRASWEEREKLAAAKLSSKISKEIKEEGFSALLLHPSSSGDDADGDLVEVHIYEGILGAAIECIRPNRPYQTGESHLLRRLVRQAAQAGTMIDLE